jgi:hypothetical protein
VGGVILDLPCVRREERRVWRRRLARDEEKSDLGLGWNNGKGARGVFVVAWDEEKKCARGVFVVAWDEEKKCARG